MILGRITKAIREQNWFAVVLEFVIVIAGVVNLRSATRPRMQRRLTGVRSPQRSRFDRMTFGCCG